MATSACLPSILQSRVFSSTQFSRSSSSVIAFARIKKHSTLSRTNLPSNKKTALDLFMAEEEDDYIEESTPTEQPKSKQKDSNSNSDSNSDSDEEEEEEYAGNDGLEAFFAQLERDINKYDPSKEKDLKLDEEDMIKFEKELEDAFNEDDLGFDEKDDLIELPELKTWQMRKLAYALKIGRRKASIKKLSEDVCLERATVLEFLKHPPPNLLLMSESLPNDNQETESITPNPPEKMESGIPNPGIDSRETESRISSSGSDSREMKSGIANTVNKYEKSHPQKRLKKVHVETLQKVYSRMKRPTKEMIESIIHVTNLPRKRIVEWFEERRVQDGVPNQSLPRGGGFRRSRNKDLSIR